MSQQNTNEIDLVSLANSNNDQFKITTHKDWVLIRVFAPLVSESLAALEASCNHLLGTKLVPVILDCKDQSDLNPLWTRFAVKLSVFLSKHQQKLACTNCNDRLKRFLQSQGLNSSLPTTESLPEAFAKVGIKQGHDLDVTLVNPFLTAANETIQSQLQITSEAGGLTLLKPNAPISGDISGIIRLNCQTLKAAVILSFPQSTIFGMVGKLTGAQPDGVTSMVKGAVGEFTNITFTRGKKQLNDMGYGIESAVPRLVEDHALPEDFQDYTGKSVAVAFKTQFGPYYSEIRLLRSA